MDTSRVTRKDRDGEGARVEVESFSTPGDSYTVSLAIPRKCECAHFVKTGAICRHIVAGTCLHKIRASAFGTRHDEEVMRDLIARVFAPRMTIVESYDAMVEVDFCKFSTPELKAAARRRHRKHLLRTLEAA